MDDVMQHSTAKHLDIYGEPNDEVKKGLEEFAEEIPVTIIQHFTGFSRFQRSFERDRAVIMHIKYPDNSERDRQK